MFLVELTLEFLREELASVDPHKELSGVLLADLPMMRRKSVAGMVVSKRVQFPALHAVLSYCFLKDQDLNHPVLPTPDWEALVERCLQIKVLWSRRSFQRSLLSLFGS